MEIQILMPKVEDAKGIDEVFYKTWLDTYPNEEAGITLDDIKDRLEKRFSAEGLKKREEQLRNAPETSKFTIAKYGDKIVGVCLMIKHPDNNQLKAIYVLPEYQGKGIGKMLWDNVKGFRDPNKPTIVQLATYNTKAMNFYKKLGFEDNGKRFTEERHRMKSGAIIPEMEMVLKA